MTVALWCPAEGLSEHEIFAIIHEGEVVHGDYYPPPGVDLSDEATLVDRYTGPELFACQFDSLADNVLIHVAREYGIDEIVMGGPTNYRCTICGANPATPQSPGDGERWIACPECEKDRLFEPTGVVE